MSGTKTERSKEEMKALGARLRQFYEAQGLDRGGFAERMGYNYDQIRSYDTGKSSPNATFFSTMADLFPDLDLAWLLTGDKNQFEPSFVAVAPDTVRDAIPIIQHIRAGKPIGNYTDDDVIGWTESSVREPDSFALQVKGDSMHPEIQDGDVVVFGPVRTFINGRIYAVVLDEEETTVKHVFRRGVGYELVPHNSSYPTKFWPENRVTALYRVLEIQRRPK